MDIKIEKNANNVAKMLSVVKLFLYKHKHISPINIIRQIPLTTYTTFFKNDGDFSSSFSLINLSSNSLILTSPKSISVLSRLLIAFLYDIYIS